MIKTNDVRLLFKDWGSPGITVFELKMFFPDAQCHLKHILRLYAKEKTMLVKMGTSWFFFPEGKDISKCTIKFRKSIQTGRHTCCIPHLRIGYFPAGSLLVFLATAPGIGYETCEASFSMSNFLSRKPTWREGRL